MSSDVNNFKRLNKFDYQRGVIDEFRKTDDSSEIAKFINKNIATMDDIEKGRLLLKLLDDKRILSELLKYELRYLKYDKKISDFHEFVKLVRETLNRYHMRAGGFLCEDTDWSEHNSSSVKYPLSSHEVIFENSIKAINRNDSQISSFIYDLLHFFKEQKPKHISLSFKLLEYTDEIYWMIFKIKEIKKDHDNGL